MIRKAFTGLWATCACVTLFSTSVFAASDIVLQSADATNLHGNWTRVPNATSAGGLMLSSVDFGWSTPNAPLAAPSDYFEFTFNAPARTPYHVWLRLRAGGNSKWNDAVWVQISDASDGTGAALYRLGSTSGLSVNLQSCNACPLSGWGWVDGAYWFAQTPTVTFATSGPHTVRVQTREDGVQFDEMVLSPATYRAIAPGTIMNDAMIVPKAAESTPFFGAPSRVPGTVQAEDFDNGGEGIAYHIASTGKSGGHYRATDVDVEAATDGGYDIRSASPSDWLNYTVEVAAAGEYVLEAGVAASGRGGTFHVEFGGANVTGGLTIADTGGWQNWTTVSKRVSLSAGRQMMRLVFEAKGATAVGNITWIRLSPAPPARRATGARAPAPTVLSTTSTSSPAPTADAQSSTGHSNPVGVPPNQVGGSPGTGPLPISSGPQPAIQIIGAPGHTITVPAGGDFQAALNSARPGDTILLAAGATFTGNFVLPLKRGTRVITIRSAASDAQLPGDGTRINPAYAAALPTLQSPNSLPALSTAAAAHHYTLKFLELRANAQGLGDIMALGDGSGAQNTLELVPHDLVVDRCYIHGDVVYGQKRGIGLNSGSTTIANSYIAEIKAMGQDSQAIAGWNGPGPYTITNNYLEAAGENIIFGGSDPPIANLITSDVTIRKNHLTKQVAWRTEGWVVKNLFELKNAQRVVVDGNVMEYNWLGGQAGFAVQLTVRNQDGTCPWCVVQQVDFTNNIVRHVGSGINILGEDYNYPSQVTNAITIRNNLFEDVSGATWGGYGWFLAVAGPTTNVTVDHNTVLQDGTSALYAYGSPMSGFVFINNIVPDNSWAIMGADASPGNGTIAMYFPNPQFANGIFAGSNPATYPQGNFYPASMSAVGFVDLPGGNYRLAPTSLYRNAATDGTDVGCNINQLNAATGMNY